MKRNMIFGLCLTLGLSVGSSGALLMSGCGGETTPDPNQNPNPNNPDPNNPNPNPNPNTMETMLSGTLAASQSLTGTVILADNVTVPAGVTLTLGAGTVVKAAAMKALTVRGTLVVSGTAQAKVVFQSKDSTIPGSWGGIAIASGGTANLSYVEIRHAGQAFQALSGSSFSLDHALIEESNIALILRSSGSITKTVIHSLGAMQAGSPVQISDSSPTFTDVLMDRSNSGTDHILVSGATSSPQFDHVELKECHCAFHFNGGTGINVTNSYVYDNYYALMLNSATNVRFSNNNFTNNRTTHLGQCGGGTLTSTGNYFSGSNMAFDSSCATQSNTAQSQTPLPGVGYRP
jgi:hypothetical protein